MMDLASSIRGSNLSDEEINKRVREAFEVLFGKAAVVMLHHMEHESGWNPEKFEKTLRHTFGATADVIIQSILERLPVQTS